MIKKICAQSKCSEFRRQPTRPELVTAPRKPERGWPVGGRARHRSLRPNNVSGGASAQPWLQPESVPGNYVEVSHHVGTANQSNSPIITALGPKREKHEQDFLLCAGLANSRTDLDSCKQDAAKIGSRRAFVQENMPCVSSPVVHTYGDDEDTSGEMAPAGSTPVSSAATAAAADGPTVDDPWGRKGQLGQHKKNMESKTMVLLPAPATGVADSAALVQNRAPSKVSARKQHARSPPPNLSAPICWTQASPTGVWRPKLDLQTPSCGVAPICTSPTFVDVHAARGSFGPPTHPDGALGQQSHTCSVHRKARSARNLCDDGNGGLRCADGFECGLRRTRALCRFFQREACTKGSTCNFSHDDV